METNLLRKLTLHADESGFGHYRRLAAANGLSGWKELARHAEVSTARSGLFSRPDHVARMLGLDKATCQMASAREEIAMGWRGMRRAGFDAVCPHCLKESVYIRLSWDHAYSVACPTHKTLLVDKCGGCGHRLSDTREEIDICPCGHHLPTNETKPASQAQLWLASIIASRGTHSGHALPTVADVELDLFSLLVRNLCQLHDPSLMVTREYAAAPRTILEAVEFLKPLESLLHDWPKGFEAHVRDRIASGPTNARTLNTRLGKWYLRLREIGMDAALNPFLDAVHRLAAAEYSTVLALDHVVGLAGRTKSHFMLPEAAARIGVHRNTLVKAIHAGEVLSVTRPYANRGLAREVPIAEVEAIAAARSGWIGEAQAREMLDVPESVFKYMTQAGLVSPDGSGRVDIRRGAPIELAAIARLQAQLMSAGIRDGVADGARVKLKDFNARHLGDRQAIVRLLKAVATGDILPMQRSPSVGELEFLKEDVDTFFASKTAEAGLTVQALAKASGWKWESISHWIDLGLLESAPAVLRGQPCRVVLPGQLLKFNQTYLPLSSMAHSLNARSSQLLDRLGDIKLFGGKALPDGAQRGALVRIADLASAALRPFV